MISFIAHRHAGKIKKYFKLGRHVKNRKKVKFERKRRFDFLLIFYRLFRIVFFRTIFPIDFETIKIKMT